MKRFGLISLLLLVVFLTGCFAPKVNVKIAPNPIKITAEKLLEDDFVIKGIELKLSTSGFSLNYEILGAEAVLFDDKDKEIVKKTVEIKKGTPIVPGVKLTEKVPEISLKELFDFDVDANLDLDLPIDDETYDALLKEKFTAYYNENWRGKVYKLEVTITGKNPTTDKANIEFN